MQAFGGGVFDEPDYRRIRPFRTIPRPVGDKFALNIVNGNDNAPDHQSAVAGEIAEAKINDGLQREAANCKQIRVLAVQSLQLEFERWVRGVVLRRCLGLGTSLPRIALLCQSIPGAVTAGPATTELDQICGTSQELTRKLEEIVWAVDPAHDSLDGIANYLGRFAQDFLSTAGISCRLDLPVQLPSQPIYARCVTICSSLLRKP